MLLDEHSYRMIWDRVYDVLNFRPSIDTKIIPFSIEEPHIVYDISRTNDLDCEQFCSLITNAFLNCTTPGELLYALDWHHSAFLFDPRITEQMKSQYIEDSRHPGVEYVAYFPGYYPDGDYYFFIDEHFRFGYLSHPWRKEVWIFGNCLMKEFDTIYVPLHWTIKEGL